MTHILLYIESCSLLLGLDRETASFLLTQIPSLGLFFCLCVHVILRHSHLIIQYFPPLTRWWIGLPPGSVSHPLSQSEYFFRHESQRKWKSCQRYFLMSSTNKNNKKKKDGLWTWKSRPSLWVHLLPPPLQKVIATFLTKINLSRILRKNIDSFSNHSVASSGIYSISLNPFHIF